MPTFDPNASYSGSASSGNSRNMSQQAQRGENYGYNFNQSQGQQTASNQSQATSQGRTESRSTSGPDPQLLQRWDQGYSDYLRFHGQTYDNMMQGYQDVLGRIGGQADRVQGMYGQLQGDVLNDIAGSDAARRGEIEDAYGRSRAASQQSLARRGLGNTTVVDSVRRGIDLDEQKALSNLAGQTAQQRAGYRAQLGSQGIAAQSQLQNQYGQLGGQYFGGQAAYQGAPLGWSPNRTDSWSLGTNESQSTSQGQSQGTQSSYGQGEQWGLNQSYGYSMGGSNQGSTQVSYQPGPPGPPGGYSTIPGNSYNTYNYYGNGEYPGDPGDPTTTTIDPATGLPVGGGGVVTTAGGQVTSGTPGPGYTPPNMNYDPYQWTNTPSTPAQTASAGGQFFPSATGIASGYNNAYPNPSTYPSLNYGNYW